MEAIIRDAPLGQIIRFLTKNKYLQYPEEKPDFQLPECWVDLLNAERGHPAAATTTGTTSETPGADRQPRSPASPDRDPEKEEQQQQQRREAENNNNDADAAAAEKAKEENIDGGGRGSSSGDEESHGRGASVADSGGAALHPVASVPVVPKTTRDGAILVDWYYTDDAANPYNWTRRKKLSLSLLICLYTFVVYTSSAIYTSSIDGIRARFGVSGIVASLGLAIYVLGYGVGPLLFSPLSEIPRIGRNPVYIVTMFLFVIISIPTALVSSYAGLVVLRFFQGFFGSPCLASGGASLGDMYALQYLPYAMMAWVAAAYCGPALGPLLSGFSVPVEGWRWSLYESIWASAPVLIAMFVFLPETSGPSILLHRARRLRRVTGSDRFMSQSEIDQRNMKPSTVIFDALIKPMEITIKDPAVLFVQVYTAIIYGIYYSFFEVFPLVYPVYYNMNYGEVGLVFLCILVSCIFGVAVYVAYLYYVFDRRAARFGFPAPEARLKPALIACVGPTIGLFMFAWTARRSIHWIAPTIGITIYGATVFIVMQCIFVYIPLSYPMYAASLFAANDFFRSALACGSIIFAHPLYGNLGVARGTSLLGGLSVIGIIGIWLLYFYGAKLRSLSKFTAHYE
ncbi:major facilitator superfamily domain-containing protein [Stachybotrys elegans]|uniref:Major facilitator superfamily domain-containing protein n=1 Tax=Stachybotrys elegans TaxID=80388 RepID=A0A8K0WW98_9HYPO|nr:major facilitator superfamily domain-containing protein [Stachybotrys elegans]